MKMKPVLLLIAAVGSTALVASAQTTTARRYVVNSFSPDDGQEGPASVPAPGQPPQPLAVPPTSVWSRRSATPTAVYTARVPYSTETPEEHGLSRRADLLSRQLAEARSDGDREKIKGELAEVLEKQFDQRQKRHEEEIKQLEAQVKKLRDLVEKRQENRREIVTARLNQVVKEAQGLGW